MARAIEDLFACGHVDGFEPVRTGILGENHRVNTSIGPFFLKRYRERVNTVVHEIKIAEMFFASHGILVILPTKDRFGRDAFWLDDCWYSLYPFVDAESPTRENMTPGLLVSLATTLANLHTAGQQFAHRPFQMIRVGNAIKLHMEITELRYLIANRSQPSEHEKMLLDLVALKEGLSKRIQVNMDPFPLAFDTLLHGDYQHFNLFARNERVTHLFDFERSALGPPTYELVRALFLDCFEDGWEKKNFDNAILYLDTYRNLRPVDFEEFIQAVHLYLFNMVHNCWLEANMIIYQSEGSIRLLTNQRKRILYLMENKPETFAKKIWRKKTGELPE